jgi:hypothetical protein
VTVTFLRPFCGYRFADRRGALACGKVGFEEDYHIDRGYERIEAKLAGIGAKIGREE